MAAHKWKFKSHFRQGAYGWKGSALAAKRVAEAVREIRKVRRNDPVEAAEGVVSFFERIVPAVEHVDDSWSRLGGALYKAMDELVSVVEEAPLDDNAREALLERLWAAIQDDDFFYLHELPERWGELCAEPTVAGQWADEFTLFLKAHASGDGMMGLHESPHRRAVGHAAGGPLP